MDFIMNNYEWIFSGIGVVVVGYLVNLFFAKKKSDSTTKEKNTNNISIVNSINSPGVTTESSHQKRFEERPKESVRILFIDDNHTDFKMVSILKKSGWINTKSVKDVTDLDDPKVKEAEILFVDINGVGTTLFKDQGLGLASALKKKYSEKKVVIYSSETKGDRFHKALREVDGCLYKDAEPYQFISIIEECK